MNLLASPSVRLVFGFAAAALVLAGCGGAKMSPAPVSSPQPVTLTVYSPCIIGGPLRKVADAYQASHPGVQVVPQPYKPLAAPAPEAGPAAVVTTGPLEIASLVRAGLVSGQGRTFALNTYPLAVVAPAEGSPKLQSLADLASPSVQRVFLEDPAVSTLGERAVQAFRKLGLWQKLAPKVISPRPGAMVLADLLAGKADAAVVFEGCLFGEAGEGGSPPKTIRVIGELPVELFSPIPYQAAALELGPHQEVARDFVGFLMGEEGRNVLQDSGLRPAK